MAKMAQRALGFLAVAAACIGACAAQGEDFGGKKESPAGNLGWEAASEATPFGQISLEGQKELDALSTGYAAAFVVAGICGQVDLAVVEKAAQTRLGRLAGQKAGAAGQGYAMDSAQRKVRAFKAAYAGERCGSEKVLRLAQMSRVLGF